MLGRPHIPRLRPPIQSGPYTPDKPLSSFTVSAPARGCIYYGVAILVAPVLVAVVGMGLELQWNNSDRLSLEFQKAAD